MSAIERAARVVHPTAFDDNFGWRPKDQAAVQAVAKGRARMVFETIDVDDLARALDPHAFAGGVEDYGALGDRQRHARRVAQTFKAHLLSE